MAINPDNITTIRVDQLASAGLTLDSLFPHTTGAELTSSTIEVLVDLVATAIGTGSGVGYLPESRTDGQVLPAIPADPSFMLVGVGTFGNLNGYPDLVCTEELNALMSVTDHWEIAVQIPITPPGGIEITNTSQLVNDGSDGINPFITLLDLPSNLILYPTNVVSDISGYSKLVTDIHDVDYNEPAVDVTTGTITTTDQLVASLATGADLINGNPGVFNITTVGNIKKVSGSGEANFYFKVYKRTSGGTETLVGTSNNTDAVTASTYVQFLTTALWDDGVFSATDRIVLKFYANRVSGGTDPVYNFQFGGDTPVRTLVPIPLSVVPGGAVTSVNGQTGVVSIDLQSVTDEGNVTTNAINIIDGSANNKVQIGNDPDVGDVNLYDPANPTKSTSLNPIQISVADGALSNSSTAIATTIQDVSNITTYKIDKITVNSVDYPLPTGATSQIATLADITGGVSDGDKGDITVSSAGTVWTIDNGLDATKLADGSVTNTELQYINSLTSNAQTQLDAKANKLDYIKLTSAYNLTSTTALQKLFNVGSGSGGAYNASANRTIRFQLEFDLTGLSASSNDISFGILGTAGIDSINYKSVAIKSANLNGLNTPVFVSGQVVTATDIVNANTTTTGKVLIHGTIVTSTAGTIILAVATSVAVGSAQVGVNSFASFEDIGADTLGATSNIS